MQSKEALIQRLRECELKYSTVANELAAGKYMTDAHAGVKMWLSGVGGLVGALRWTLGSSTFLASFEPIDPDYINRMLGKNLPWWDEKEDALPTGKRLHFEMEEIPPQRMRAQGDIRQMLHRAVEVHKRVYRINMFHTGLWHPTFQGRVHRWLVFVENVIRVLDWVLNNRDANATFYMINKTSMEEMAKAKQQVRHYDALTIAGLRHKLEAPDHRPEDFE